MPISTRCAPEATSSEIEQRRGRKIGIARRHERHERPAFLAPELGKQCRCGSEHPLLWTDLFATWTSRNSVRNGGPYSDRFTPEPRDFVGVLVSAAGEADDQDLAGPQSGAASLNAWARAWLDSRAGRMPSCRAVTL